MDGATGGPNWLGLLQWSLAHSDGTAPTDTTGMSAEDQAWLTNVLKESTKNEADRLKEIYIDIMQVVDAQGIDTAKEESFADKLEELRDIVEQIDMAQVFAKFGGITCLASLCSIEGLPMAIKHIAASTIGTVSQNNPAVQEIILINNTVTLLVGKFMECVQKSTVGHLKLAEKLTYAISCSIRNHFPAEKAFIASHAVTFLHAALATQSKGLVTRVFFLAHALISSDSASLTDVQIICSEVMPVLLPYFSFDDVQLRETASQLLIAVLHTEMGWSQFGEGMPCHVEFTAAVRQMQAQATEDTEHVDRLVAEIVLASKTKHVIYPRSVTEAAAAPQQQVLRIAPPSLEASSTIP